jgi:hypothetical protein
VSVFLHAQLDEIYRLVRDLMVIQKIKFVRVFLSPPLFKKFSKIFFPN